MLFSCTLVVNNLSKYARIGTLEGNEGQWHTRKILFFYTELISWLTQHKHALNSNQHKRILTKENRKVSSQLGLYRSI